jgi:hypothetical protein
MKGTITDKTKKKHIHILGLAMLLLLLLAGTAIANTIIVSGTITEMKHPAYLNYSYLTVRDKNGNDHGFEKIPLEKLENLKIGDNVTVVAYDDGNVTIQKTENASDFLSIASVVAIFGLVAVIVRRKS